MRSDHIHQQATAAAVQRQFHAPAMPGATSYREIAAQSREAAITLVTDEGDVVTLTSAEAAAQAMSYRQQTGAFGTGENFTTASLGYESLSLAVEGDLNDEELDDIRALVDDLLDIAESFFAGRTDEALAGALDLNDLGSINRLSASFSQTTAIVSQLATSHPLPAVDADSLPELGEKLRDRIESSVAGNYGETLRSRWRQIIDFLDQQPTETESDAADALATVVPPAASGADVDTTVGRMLERAAETARRHPRLTPVMPALVNRAVDEAAGDGKPWRTAFGPAVKHGFLESFNDWLLSV